MAQRMLRHKAKKIAPKAEVREAERKFVLVGTYKDGQLEGWPGYYNYPIFEGDKIDEESARKINEIWLFNGVKDGKFFAAEFVGIKTREELKRDYGYPAKGKGHGTGRYLLYKIGKTQIYNPASGLAEQVVVRAKDFAKRSPKIASQLKAYLESPARKDPVLANLVPKILTKLSPKILRVCEPAVQLELFSVNHENTSQLHDIVYIENVRGCNLSTMELMVNQIFEEDCLLCMGRIPDASIDMILCDLPYGMTQNDWDSFIPLDALWEQYRRIIKPNGAIVLTAQGLFTARLIMSQPSLYKYSWIWEKSKPTNFLNAKKQPLRKHEDVCIFYKNQPTYHPQMTPGMPYDKGVRKNQLSGCYGDFMPVHVACNDGRRYPTDVVYFKTAESEGEVIHPTQKPVALGRYFVRTYTNPGDIVLDNTCGSGSFLVAALEEGRNFIGIEKNENVALFKRGEINYINEAKCRLAKAWNKMDHGARKTVLPLNLIAEFVERYGV